MKFQILITLAIRGINAKKEYKKLKREKEKELREKRAKEEQGF